MKKKIVISDLWELDKEKAQEINRMVNLADIKFVLGEDHECIRLCQDAFDKCFNYRALIKCPDDKHQLKQVMDYLNDLGKSAFASIEDQQLKRREYEAYESTRAVKSSLNR